MLSDDAREESPVTDQIRFGDAVALIIPCILAAALSIAQGLPVTMRYEVLIRWLQLLFVGTLLFWPARHLDTRLRLDRSATALLAVWVGFTILSVLFAMYPFTAFIRQAEWMTHMLFGIVLWRFLQDNPPALRYILRLVPAGFLLTAGFELAYWYSLDNPHAHDWCNVTPLFGHMRHFGYYAMAGTIFCASPMLLEARFAWRRWLGVFLVLLVCWSFLMWTGGRAAIGSTFIAIAIIAWFAPRRAGIWLVAMTVLAALIGGWISTFYWVDSPCAGLSNVADRVAGPSFLTGRLNIWGSALEPMTGFRWLVGLGPNAYAYLPDKAYGLHPHSLIVQFVTDWGVLGAASFLGLLLVGLWKGLVRLRIEVDPLARMARVVALALVVGSSVHSLVDGLFYHAQPLLLIAIGFAILLLPVGERRPQMIDETIVYRFTSRRVLRAVGILLALVFLSSSNMLYGMLF